VIIPENSVQFQDMTVIQQLRNNLQPQGTAPVVILRTAGIGIELHADFVTKCIDELARMELLAELGGAPSNLERLAFMLLCDSAYIDLKKDPV
jgi:hypothetical protein